MNSLGTLTSNLLEEIFFNTKKLSAFALRYLFFFLNLIVITGLGLDLSTIYSQLVNVPTIVCVFPIYTVIITDQCASQRKKVKPPRLLTTNTMQRIII